MSQESQRQHNLTQAIPEPSYATNMRMIEAYVRKTPGTSAEHVQKSSANGWDVTERQQVRNWSYRHPLNGPANLEILMEEELRDESRRAPGMSQDEEYSRVNITVNYCGYVHSALFWKGKVWVSSIDLPGSRRPSHIQPLYHEEEQNMWSNNSAEARMILARALEYLQKPDLHKAA